MHQSVDLLAGLVAGGAVGVICHRGRRIVDGWVVVGTAALALAAIGRVELPGRAPAWALVLAIGGAGGLGAWRLLRQPSPHEPAAPWAATALAVTLVAVWAAVPENGQVLACAGAWAGLLLGARGRVDLAPVAAVVGPIVGGLVLLGEPRTALSALGAVATLGVALWHLPAGAVRRVPDDRPRKWLGLFVIHATTALVAARWVGSAADATWGRLALVAGLGIVATGLHEQRR